MRQTIGLRILLALAIPAFAWGETSTSEVCVAICSPRDAITVTSNWHFVSGQVQPPTTNLADLVVIVQNRGEHPISLFEEWNSWGYCNLKFVFMGGDHEFWVTKTPGFWYRNFPSWVTLAPGASMRIPVAFTASSWTGLDAVLAHTNWVTEIRALYEQRRSLVPSLMSRGAWEGTVSSPYYPVATLLPRFHFAAIPRTEEAKPLADEIKVNIH